ncbi:MAG: zinc ribbon domain-containing protein [Candidatus Hodarchaeales archaeon]
MKNPNQNKACSSCGAKVAPIAKFCTWCGYKFDHTQAMTTQPDSNTIIVDDQVYNGNEPMLFKIKREKNGNKFEIKDGTNTKILEAKLAFETGVFRSTRKHKEEAKMREEANAGNFRYVPLYTLHDAHKIPVGEISMNTEIFFFSNKTAEYQRRSGFYRNLYKNLYTEIEGNLKPLVIKNLNSKNLAFLNVPFSERLLSFTQRQAALPNQDRINPDQFHVETNSGSFKFNFSQEIRGKFFKNNHIVNVDILDPQHNKSLSIIERKKNNYEMTLYRGLSPFVAQSIAFLISHVVWLPPAPSTD